MKLKIPLSVEPQSYVRRQDDAASGDRYVSCQLGWPETDEGR
jgi:hypothetical protein